MGRKIFFLLSIIVIFSFWNHFFLEEEHVPDIQEPYIEESSSEEPSPKESLQIKPRPVIVKDTIPSSFPKRDIESEDYTYQDEKGNIHITHVVVDEDYLISHGDIIVEDRDNLDLYKYGRMPLTIPKIKLWPKGIIPVVIEKSLKQKKLIEKILRDMESVTPLSFPVKKRHKHFVRFKKGLRHCYSRVGMKGGEQDISLSPRCRKREIIHEIMHTIGFLHEQNRPDRDQYVQILWENIDEKHHPQFKKIKTDLWEKTSFPFTFKSVMLYSSRTFASEGYSMISLDGDPFDHYPTLSEEDIRRVNFLYGNSQSR